MQSFLGLFKNFCETEDLRLLRAEYFFLFFCTVIIVHKLLNCKMLKPAIKNFTAGQAFVGGSAVVKRKEMAEHFAVAFPGIILSDHDYFAANLKDIPVTLPKL